MFVDLVGKSLQTVQLFEARSREAARMTSHAFQFLFKGRESFAFSRLAACEKLAVDMEAKARTLEKGFQEAVDKIKKIIEEATRRRGDHQKARVAIKKEQVDLAAKKSQAEYEKEVAGREAETWRR